MKTNSIRNEPSLRPYTTRSAIFIHPIRISKYIQYITIWRRRTLQRTCVHASFPPFLTGNNARAHTPKAAAHAHLNVPIQKYTSLKSSARQAFDAYSSAISARGSTDMCPSSAPLTDSPFSPCHSRNAAHSFRWVFFFVFVAVDFLLFLVFSSAFFRFSDFFPSQSSCRFEGRTSLQTRKKSSPSWANVLYLRSLFRRKYPFFDTLRIQFRCFVVQTNQAYSV